MLLKLKPNNITFTAKVADMPVYYHTFESSFVKRGDRRIVSLFFFICLVRATIIVVVNVALSKKIVSLSRPAA